MHAIEQGWQSFQQGDLASAERIADDAIRIEPTLAGGWFLRGAVRHLQGDSAAAMLCYERACELNPDHIGPLNNLGVLYAAAGRHQDALAVLAKYLGALPEDAAANANYANSLAALGRTEDAANHYRRALANWPDFFDALINLGAMLLNQDNAEGALPLLERAFAIQPNSLHANMNLGLAFFKLKQDDAAFFHFAEALKADPQNYESLIYQGILFARRRNFEQATACLRYAIHMRPSEAGGYDNLGMALLEVGNRDEALDCLRRAVELRPDCAGAQANLGKALTELCHFSEAEVHLREALRLKPDHANAHNVFGLIQYHRGDDDASKSHFEEALRLNSDLPGTRLNLAFVRLRQGDFAGGWPDYELRAMALNPHDVPCSAPRWDGADLAGKTILVRAEQGCGDILQFVRYLPLVRSKGARVVCELPDRLHPIVARCDGFDELIAAGDPLPPVDLQIPMMSLPYALGSIEAPECYLRADPNLVESWGRELQLTGGFKIAVAWQGDPAFRFDLLRSIPLAHFESIARIPGVKLISVQKHVGLDQIEENRERVPLVDFGARLDEASGAFMDTAAIMKNVDLVITSDSAIAHLAGGLGVPTWLVLYHAPDWRWLRDRDDCPWYPTMRLFRQRQSRDWKDVAVRLAEAVRMEMARRDAFTQSTDETLRSAFFVATSPGELLDKFSILQIKSERLTNPAQIKNVRNEIRLLEQHRDRLLTGVSSLSEFVEQLKKVNETLWQVEEDIRSCERAKDFGPRFIELARSVYKHNDRRAALKRKINLSLGSPLTEEKTFGLSSDN